MNKTKKLFSASNGVGRSVRTGLQSFVGILAFIVAFMSLPQVQDVLVHNNLLTVTACATTIGFVAGLQNAVEKLLRDLFND